MLGNEMDPSSSPPRALNTENYHHNNNYYGNRRVFTNKPGFVRNDRPEGRVEKPRNRRWDQVGDEKGNYGRRPPIRSAEEIVESKPPFKPYTKPYNNGYQKPFKKPFNKPYHGKPFQSTNHSNNSQHLQVRPQPAINSAEDVPCSFWLHELTGGYAQFREIREASSIASSKPILDALCENEHAVILFWDSKEAYFYGAAVIDKPLLKENPHEFVLLWVYLTDVSCTKFFGEVNFESFLETGSVPSGLGNEILKRMAANETQLHDLKRIPLKPFEIAVSNTSQAPPVEERECFDDFLTDYF